MYYYYLSTLFARIWHLLIYRVAPKKFYIFNHTFGTVRQNETDITKMFTEFLGIKIRMQFLCSC